MFFKDWVLALVSACVLMVTGLFAGMGIPALLLGVYFYWEAWKLFDHKYPMETEDV